MSEIADANAKGSKRPNRVSFVAGVIYGFRTLGPALCLRLRKKPTQNFRTLKRFGSLEPFERSLN